jgi:cytochrome c-type biogenesis protein CcmH
MIWLAIFLVSIAALAPTLVALRGTARNRDRGEAALALHRAQLGELERDRAEGRIDNSEHAAALLEVQRRALAAADMRDSAPSQGARRPLIVVLLLVPITALGLYMISGRPDMPSAPPVLQAEQREAQEEEMIDQLRHAVAEVDPHSPRAREGNTLLASIDESRGDFAGAAAAWKAALVSGFDPLIAAHAAEAATRAEGHVSPESAELFRKALAAAPPDAPWRDAVEKRLAEQ